LASGWSFGAIRIEMDGLRVVLGREFGDAFRRHLVLLARLDHLADREVVEVLAAQLTVSGLAISPRTESVSRSARIRFKRTRWHDSRRFGAPICHRTLRLPV